MTRKLLNSSGAQRGNLRLVGAGLLALGSLGFLGVQYLNVQGRSEAVNAAAEAPVAMGGGEAAPAPVPVMGPPSPEERDQMRAQILGSLDLTEAQRDAIAKIDEELPPGPENRRARLAAMAEVLTPEQIEQVRGQRQAIRQARLNQRLSVLPPEERDKFMDKLEDRIAERQAQGLGPRFGGPPPADPRPTPAN